MEQNLSKFYQSFHEYHEKYGFSHHLTSKINYFKSEIGKDKKILDLGSRDGTLIRNFLVGNNVTCLDIDQRACDLCRSNLKIEVVYHNLNEKLPLGNEQYDLVLMSDVLEHVFLTQHLVSEAYRVLKNGGILLGSTPNAYYWTSRLKMMHGLDLVNYNDPTHVRFFSKQSLQKTLDEVFDRNIIKSYGKHLLSGLWPEMFASDFFWKSIKL